MQAHERLIAVMKHYGLNKNSFSVQIGLTNTAIGKIIKEKRKPNQTTIMKIVSRFPEINAEWLLTGQGEMLIDKKEAQKVTIGNQNKDIIVGSGGIDKSKTETHNIYGITNGEFLLALKDRYDYLQDKEKQLDNLIKLNRELTAGNRELTADKKDYGKSLAIIENLTATNTKLMEKIMLLEEEKNKMIAEIAEKTIQITELQRKLK